MTAIEPGTPRRRVEPDPMAEVVELLRDLRRRVSVLERGTRASSSDTSSTSSEGTN